jgi:hypothetical protein
VMVHLPEAKGVKAHSEELRWLVKHKASARR